MIRILLILLLLCSVASAQDVAQTRLVPVDRTAEIRTSITPDGDPVTLTMATPVRSFLARVARGVVWRWAPPSEHHRCAVTVRMPNGSAGSGTIIRLRPGGAVILTASHVAEQQPYATIGFYDGTTTRGQFLVDWSHYDLAAIKIDRLPAGVTGLPIASADPSESDLVEVMGFGGPRYGTFRPYVATRVTGMGALCVDAPSISGDSGGGMVTRGGVVGVQFGAYGQQFASLPAANGRRVQLVYPASSKANAQIIRTFIGRACQIGYRGQCQPDIQIQPRGIGGSDRQFYPQQAEPSVVIEPQFDAPVVSQPVTSVPMQIDYQRLAVELAGRPEARGPEGQRGIDGRSGERGPPGLPGPPGRNAEVTASQLAAIGAAVANELRNDPSMRGVDGRTPTSQEIRDAIDMDQFASEIISRLPSQQAQRVLLVDGSRKAVIDDETYAPGEPIVLDVQSILRAASRRE